MYVKIREFCCFLLHVIVISIHYKNKNKKKKQQKYSSQIADFSLINRQKRELNKNYIFLWFESN